MKHLDLERSHVSVHAHALHPPTHTPLWVFQVSENVVSSPIPDPRLPALRLNRFLHPRSHITFAMLAGHCSEFGEAQGGRSTLEMQFQRHRGQPEQLRNWNKQTKQKSAFRPADLIWEMWPPSRIGKWPCRDMESVWVFHSVHISCNYTRRATFSILQFFYFNF